MTRHFPLLLVFVAAACGRGNAGAAGRSDSRLIAPRAACWSGAIRGTRGFRAPGTWS
jgi:hypothetical protein